MTACDIDQRSSRSTDLAQLRNNYLIQAEEGYVYIRHRCSCVEVERH